MVRNIDEANLRKKEFEAAQQQKPDDVQIDEHGGPVAGVALEDGASAAS
jgi:hypothetical protein